MATASSRPTDNFFDGESMPRELRLEIFGQAAGDGTVPRTPEQLSTLLNLSVIDQQTHEDVSKWLQCEYDKKAQEIVEDINTNGWPSPENLTLRAQINDRVLQKLVDDEYFISKHKIDLSNTAVTNNVFTSLVQLPNLWHLNLSGCTGITNDAVRLLRQMLPNTKI